VNIQRLVPYSWFAATPNINMVNPLMTETINSANAAASTLFLGHNGEWWDFWLIVSVIVAALVATTIGVTTAGSIISHKREAAASERTFDEYKLETGKKIAEAEEHTAEAQLETERLKKELGWRDVTQSQVKQLTTMLRGKAIQVSYFWTAGDAEGSYFAHRLAQALRIAGVKPNVQAAYETVTAAAKRAQ
jgi:hypothetical protein